MIVAARHDTGDVGVISIPRDLWVAIPGAEPGRINKVYRVGNMLHGKGGGHRAIKQVIKNELGIGIDYTAAVDFGGFEKLIDLLGGIDVDVECPIKDNFIAPRSETGYEKLALAAGRHRMSGRTALLFSRSRHGRTDLDRARRQQAVLLGIKRRASSLDVIPRLPALFTEFHQHVATDLDMTGALRMVQIASAAGSGMVHGMVLRPPLVHSWRSPEGKAALRLNRTAFASALEELFDAPAPGARSRPACPAPDRALRWRELARARKARKAAERAAREGRDAGLPGEVDGGLAL
jgi:LCP family protein required for cell wall assembly